MPLLWAPGTAPNTAGTGGARRKSVTKVQPCWLHREKLGAPGVGIRAHAGFAGWLRQSFEQKAFNAAARAGAPRRRIGVMAGCPQR